MSDLKNQIFALLKKCPDNVFVNGEFSEVMYYVDDVLSYKLHLDHNKKQEAILYIYSVSSTFWKTITLTEKEFMDIKWQIADWRSAIEAKLFEDFAKFAESEPNSMDDLLND